MLIEKKIFTRLGQCGISSWLKLEILHRNLIKVEQLCTTGSRSCLEIADDFIEV